VHCAVRRGWILFGVVGWREGGRGGFKYNLLNTITSALDCDGIFFNFSVSVLFITYNNYVVYYFPTLVAKK